MPIYCGVDFYVRQQTICDCDTADGVLHRRELDHQKDAVRGFYSQLTGEVIVGLEASGYIILSICTKLAAACGDLEEE